MPIDGLGDLRDGCGDGIGYFAILLVDDPEDIGGRKGIDGLGSGIALFGEKIFEHRYTKARDGLFQAGVPGYIR